jgi:REP element-mobilizing transposase RayT
MAKNNENNNKTEKDEHITKSHNKTLLLYHLVFPVKYRKELLTKDVENTIKEVCKRIEIGYEINFIEIGVDLDHIHFLIQGIPNMSITQMITIIKSITSREIFKLHPTVKKYLYGGNFWTSGYYANTVGEFGTREVIQNYVKNQGNDYKKDYKQIYLKQQPYLFDFMNK